MPFKVLSDIAKNEQIVKLIFDNLRNIGICAVVVITANWIQKSQGTQLENYFALATSSLLYIISFCLFFINMEAGLHKLRSLKLSRWVLAVFGAVYGLCIAMSSST